MTTTKRALPALVEGFGVRDESCRHYRGCFDRWAASTKRITSWAHCPTGCAHHDPQESRAVSKIGCTSAEGVRVGGPTL